MEKVPGYKPVVPAIKPSFRRKPESRTLGSRCTPFREDFLDSGFRRNDGGLGFGQLSCIPINPMVL